jgi:flavin-dependent dehydrogenase
MSTARPIRIVGGGLAGLTLGIGLRELAVPVVVGEAGGYPRHRVCGEFISGTGQRVLRELGLLDLLLEKGGRWARTVLVCTDWLASRVMHLPEPALCLARYQLDQILATRFVEAGGELHCNLRWPGTGEGVVRASGRQAQPIANGWRWIGLKAHAQAAVLRADLEMHFLRHGYVGLCQLDNNKVNVCGLFRIRTALPDLAQRWREWLRGIPGSPLHHRLGRAVFDEATFCSVSGLSYEPRKAADHGECRIGDALTMTPPITGNGMSMAFESAHLAKSPLHAYSRRQIGWIEARQRIAEACNARFADRLAWAGPLHRMLFQPPLRNALVLLALGCPCLLRAFFSKTR